VLLTLDTTRADHVGRAGASLTPNLDALGKRGTRYTRAVTAAPLTLPAHCTLLTGLEPPAHGVRDNGVVALPAGPPTLATVLAARGYRTAAFVSSRVLDRRFGLARGFATYDDRMVAERVGEQGYPERDAAAVTTAALRWAAALPPGRPYFLWVHYYDPHAPYQPPGTVPGSSTAERYAGEVAYMDREIGRLLAGLPGRAEARVVAAVGDHGEMLGEHGERDHGIFLYRAALEVPLVVAGPRVPAGRVVEATVATRGLAAGLLGVLGLARDASPFGEPLPGLRAEASAPGAQVVYSETFLPATAYGWSPLKAVSDGRWKYIAAPRPELYDLQADPGETRDLVAQQPQEAGRLQRVLAAHESAAPRQAAPAVTLDPTHAEALRSLGYHAGAPTTRGSGLDPKDGLALLAEFDQAKAWMREGRYREAEAKLDDLVRRNPGNVPFLSRLAEAQTGSGRREAAVATLKHAASLNPALDFLHVALAEALLALGRVPEARDEYELTVQLNPRFAQAWMGLAEIALRAGRAADELEILRRADAAGTESGAVLSRLAQLEIASGDLDAAEAHARQATRLVPEFGPAWWLWGEVAEKRNQTRDAVARFEKAVALGVADPRALAKLERLRQSLRDAR
jgi:arylsulfatase A-like enzyme/Flp pilus assembly protein TadD